MKRERRKTVFTPLEAIRRHCTQCVGGSPFEVKNCDGDHCLNGGSADNGVCWFYNFRLGRGRPSVKTIRKVCLWCQGGSPDLVRECVEGTAHSGVEACPLYCYRMGRNPSRAGMGGKFPGKQAVSPGFAA